MGRYYRTSRSNPVDYIAEDNVPLMERALKFNDSAITQELDQSQKIGDTASSFNYLVDDTQRAAAIAREYDKKVNDLTTSISGDPANWRDKRQTIAGLSRDLLSNYKTGEISKIVANHAAYTTFKGNLNKSVEQWNKYGGAKGGVSPDRAAAYEKYYLDQWKKKGNDNGTNYNSDGSYNLFHADDVGANIDMNKIVRTGMDKIKADKSYGYETHSDGTSWAFITNKEKKEQITPEKLWSIGWGNIQSNPELIRQLGSDRQVGLLGNAQFSNPIKSVDISEQEQSTIDKIQGDINRIQDPTLKVQKQQHLNEQIQELKGRVELDNDSYFASSLRSAGETFGFSNVEKGNEMKANPMYGKIYGEKMANARNSSNNYSREKIASMLEIGRNDRDQAHLAMDQYKWDNPHLSAKDAEAKSVSNRLTSILGLGGTKTDLNTMLDDPGMNVYGYNGQDGMKSAVDVAQTIDRLKVKGGELQGIVNNAKTQTEKQLAELNLQKNRDQLTQASDLYSKAIDDGIKLAVSNKEVSNDDLALYNKVLAGGQQNIQANINKEAREYLQNSPIYGNKLNTTDGIKQFNTVKARLLAKFSSTKSTIDKYRNMVVKNFNENSKKANGQIVKTTKEQNDDILTDIPVSSTYYKLYDRENGRELSTDADNGLASYLKDNNKTLADIIDIQGAALPNGANGTDGALVRVKIKDNVKGIEKLGGKIVMMSLPPQTKTRLANQFKGSADKDVKAFGDKMSNEQRSHFINTLDRVSEHSADLTAKGIEAMPLGQITIETPTGIHTIRSVPQKIGGKTVYKGMMMNEKGEFEQIGSTNRNDGLFDSNTDLWEQLQAPLFPVQK